MHKLKRVLTNIIYRYQTGFMNGRCRSENTRLVYHIIHYAEKSIPVLSLTDFENAFDSVSSIFVKKTLGFRFGPDTLKKKKKWLMYFTKIFFVVNRQLSTLFPVERGCRQGDPLCPVFHCERTI